MINDRACERSESISSISITSLASGSSLRVVNEVYRRPSMALKLTVNRQKNVIFCGQLSKMQVKINRQKAWKFSAHYFSWSSRHSGSWRISKLENQFPCSQKYSNVLKPTYILKDF